MNAHILRRCLLLCAVLFLGACGEKTALPPDPLRPVLTTILDASADSGGGATYSGEVRSRYETPLGFRISGKISARLVDAGMQVKAGEVLARLDPADTMLSAASATAQLELAEVDLRRYRELRGKNFVSQSALDAKETAFKAMRAQADLARNQSSYTILRADQAGVVELVAAEVGQVVAAGQTVMRVARTDTLEVAVAIPETHRPEMRVAKAAVISLWSNENASFKGILREISPTADALTRTYAARVSILNPDDQVLLGMTANVRFQAAVSESQLRVPLTAIFQHAGQPALWVVGADDTVSLRPVAVAAYGETTATLGSGAMPGERIVIAGVHKLSAGEKIKRADQPLAPVQ